MSENFGDATRAAAVTGNGDTSDGADETIQTVGRADADADAARSGADVEDTGLAGTQGLDVGDGSAATDTDGVPVGTADADADAARTGADTDAT